MSIPIEAVERATDAIVVAAVSFVDTSSGTEAVEAIARQVYGPARTVVIGGGDDGRGFAGERELEWAESLGEMVATLDSAVDFVWVVHGDATPRPDALGSLVSESDRNDASVVGSKILDHDHSDRLESVGGATDVFGEPYLGLDPDEVDLEQYDVVRDVAFVSGVSLLIRRDLLRGLNGLDRLLPPVAAGMDLSQRARLAGARVMVVPSSEVLHRRACNHDVAGWRETAGRMRSMFKAYRPVTLAWLVPVGFMVGVIDGFARLFLGDTRSFREYLRAFSWNVMRLPSTLAARRAVAAIRATGDEELFRYQVTGSMRLRRLGTDLGERLGWIIDTEPGVVTEEELHDDTSAAGPIVAALSLLVVAIASRQLWFGTAPAGGFQLPLGNDPATVLWSFAGGWSPTELGSHIPPHPIAALVSGLQYLAFGWQGIHWLVALAAGVFGFFGVGRLLAVLGVEGPTRHLAGVVYLVGPVALQVGAAGYWPATVAMGAAPWVLVVAQRRPEGKRRAIGRLAALVVTGAILGAAAPLAAGALLVVAAVAAVFRLMRPGSLPAVVVAGLAGALAASPYLYVIDLRRLTEGVVIDPRPSSMVGLIAVAVACLVTVGFATGRRWKVAGLGGVVLTAALAAPWVPSFAGEVAVAVVVVASLGMALVVGAALGTGGDSTGLSRVMRVVGVLAGVVVLAVSTVAIPSGRAGFGSDDWRGRLSFVAALAPPTGADRVLVIADPSIMPGEYRNGPGFAYRLVQGSNVTLDQAWLPAGGAGDAALDDVLGRIASLDQPRPGAALAPFAVRWVMVQNDLVVADAFVAQLDMTELPVTAGFRVFANEAATPTFSASDGSAWTAAGALATGPSSTATVRIAYDFDPRFGPAVKADDWAVAVSASQGAVSFQVGAGRRLLALGTVLILALALVGWWVGRERGA